MMTTSGQAGALIAGRYRLERPTGGGTWPEEIWQGFDETLNRPVMLRLLPLAGEGEPDLDEQVQSVVAHVARLGHPNIAQVYDVGHEDAVRYVVSEWTGGRTLGQIMSTGRQNWQRTVDWGQQIAEALGALHAVGLVDGVLGPETVSVLDDRRVKLTDVGLGVPQDTPAARQGGGADDRTRLLAPQDGGDEPTRVVPPFGADPGADEPTRVVPPYGDAEATRVVPGGSGGGRGAVPPGASSDVYALGAILWTAMVGTPPEVGPGDTAGPDLGPLRETGAPSDLAALLQSMLAASSSLRPSATVAAHRFAALSMEARESRPDAPPPTAALSVPATTQGLGGSEPTRAMRAGSAAPREERAPEPPATSRGKLAGIAVGVILLLVVAGVALALVFNNNTDNVPTGTASNTLPTSSPGSISVSANASTSAAQPSTSTQPTTPSASATTASPSETPTASASESSTPTTTETATASASASASPSASSSTGSASASASQQPPAQPGT